MHLSHNLRFPTMWYVRWAWAYAQSNQSLCKSLEYSRTVKLLTEHNLERRLYRHVWVYTCQKPHCWKSHDVAHIAWVSYPITLFLGRNNFEVVWHGMLYLIITQNLHRTWLWVHNSLLTHLCRMDSPPLSIGTVHFCFKGCWVVFFIFIQILIEQSACKQWRPWSEHAVWSGSPLFAYVPQKGR